MAVGFELALDVQLLDSLLLNILGGSEGDDLGALFASQSKAASIAKIENKAVSKRVQFVAHHPRGKNGTAICTSLDGKTWDADDTNIAAIPQHFGCRSQYRFIGGLISAS
jgi:protein gp37